MAAIQKFPVSIVSGLSLMIVGGVLCAFAAISNVDFLLGPGGPTQIPLPLHPSEAVNTTIVAANELSLNSAYKMGWSLAPK